MRRHSKALRADLTDAILFRANLTGTYLYGARLTFAIWSNTTCPNGTVTITGC